MPNVGSIGHNDFDYFALVSITVFITMLLYFLNYLHMLVLPLAIFSWATNAVFLLKNVLKYIVALYCLEKLVYCENSVLQTWLAQAILLGIK